MRLFVRHATIYSFAEPQSRLVELLRVTPSSFVGQNVVDWQIDVDCDARIKSGRDGHGNEIAMVYINGPVQRLRIAVTGEVLTDDRAGMVGGTAETLPPLLYARPSALAEADDALAALAAEAAGGGGATLSAMHRLMALVHERVAFDPQPRADTSRTAAQAFALGHGVCQDHAHILVACARALGLPARYVSGHLWRGEEEGPQRATHAWAEVNLPDYGWIGFDSVQNHCPDDRYIRVATGLDYGEAAPVTGARVGRGPEWLEVTVVVTSERLR